MTIVEGDCMDALLCVCQMIAAWLEHVRVQMTMYRELVSVGYGGHYQHNVVTVILVPLCCAPIQST